MVNEARSAHLTLLKQYKYQNYLFRFDDGIINNIFQNPGCKFFRHRRHLADSLPCDTENFDVELDKLKKKMENVACEIFAAISYAEHVY